MCQLTLTLHSDHGLGRPALDGQMLLLPLADRRGGITHALGCMAASGTIGYPPRRFALSQCQRRRSEGTATEAVKADTRAGSLTGLGEAPASFRPRPALRLVHDTDRPDD